ncbi:DUF2141 domain-containing protein [Brevundimonas sp.]|uniref:DUF2141 domain-containing protein n=1 Tax=Brevundimonas sp. TaxID=1871086 RepID=UPI002D496F85|nr:DUF2141 domain-containing protein [Brevundimonas sp.]HYC99112.1 DUF2141 domain-containing protein [Brevundimonas sp.]
MIRLQIATLSAAAAGLLLLSSPVLARTAGGDGSVSLTFETSARTGAVMVALYDSSAAWSGGRPVGQMKLDVAAGETTATFDGLPAGDYAARAFHDVNGDGEMNVNPFGIPTEPYAFSNNAVGNMGPARWDQARFTVSGATAQTIRLR